MMKEVICETCNGRGYINIGTDGIEWAEQCEICAGRGVIMQPMTNGDCMRDMSDKELAIALVKYKGTEKRTTQYGGHEHIFYGPNGEKCGTKAYAIELWEKWLKQPAKGNENGLL